MESLELPWLDASERRPLADRIAASVARSIADGDIDPGDLLTEVDVAAEHGASRTPAREAMLKLSAWGLVRLVPKKGALVTSPTARERQELLSVRSMLEGHAIARIVGDDEMRMSLLEALEPILADQADSVGRPAEFAVHDHAFHLRIIRHERNSVVEEIIASLAPRLYRLSRLAVTAATADLTALHREHVELTDAVRRQDVAAFRDLIDRHLTSGHEHYEVGK
ncbi:GntR family transcriptional regulator [Brachybacterium sacelli]|uniref:DNA-binding GntR family transcriptional regulator n=1 Tax=Brachybacterium sacelli TaxID=173364 RepID=A0ABS4WWW4_9MICO|nr:GntR family transcriptional regulator [Brachybacterium sacelli]MBP2380697.1 DNA-binding GntR family transcriptional regulator [Brachybacterium sacelli]